MAHPSASCAGERVTRPKPTISCEGVEGVLYGQVGAVVELGTNNGPSDLEKDLGGPFDVDCVPDRPLPLTNVEYFSEKPADPAALDVGGPASHGSVDEGGFSEEGSSQQLILPVVICGDLNESAESPGDRARPVEDLFGPGQEPLEGGLDHGHVGVLFRGEVDVEAALAGLGRSGDLLNRGPAIPETPKLLLGGLDEPVLW